jgi:Methyltransferase domain
MLTDIMVSGVFPLDTSLLRAEGLVRHRVRQRKFLLDYIPENSVGAEIGVFTGLFSSLFAKHPKISQVTFVDPWWRAFGERYPDWGGYTDRGRLKTRSAYEVARRRISRAGRRNRIVEVAFSYEWLESQPDESLDWAYLDSTHTYGGTKRELALLDRKIKEDGILLGDDWHVERHHQHYGVALAVSEFLRTSEFEPVVCGVCSQWVLRRRLKSSADLPILWEDPFYRAGFVRGREQIGEPIGPSLRDLPAAPIPGYPGTAR